jgi:hypothetical protein
MGSSTIDSSIKAGVGSHLAIDLVSFLIGTVYPWASGPVKDLRCSARFGQTNATLMVFAPIKSMLSSDGGRPSVASFLKYFSY